MSELLDQLLKTNEADAIEHHLNSLLGYKEQVPDIETFIDDDYYLGKFLGGDLIYPIWRQAAKELYPTPYKTVAVEVFLTGGIGLGKSTFAKLIVAFDFCKLLCLATPQEHYKLTPTTVIKYLLMNATKDLAEGVLLQEMMEWFEGSPFFRNMLDPKGHTLFRNRIDIGAGSRGKDALGQAAVGAIFSEINDMTVVHGQAEDVFDTINTRMYSRFGGKGADIIGHIILDSSNKGAKSFLDTRLTEKKKNGATDFIVFRFAHWEAKWHLGGYSGEWFDYYAGDEHVDPFLLTGEEEERIISALKPERLLKAPIEHLEEFQFNIIKSIRDLAGVSTFGAHQYMSNVSKVNEAFCRANPVTVDVISLDFFDKDQTLDKYIDIDLLARINKSNRFVHIDLGITGDSTGIACSYLDGFTDVRRHNALNGDVIINREPEFVCEWTMEIQCIPGQQVPIYKIKEFILDAIARGYPITVVSTDGFQSTNLRQDLHLRGVTTDLISCDRTKDPFDYLRNCVLEGRLKSARTEKVVTEIMELEDTGRKYDHPPDGTKDIIDSVAGSIWNIQKHLEKAGVLNTAGDVVKGIQQYMDDQAKPQKKLENHLLDLLGRR